MGKMNKEWHTHSRMPKNATRSTRSADRVPSNPCEELHLSRDAAGIWWKKFCAPFGKNDNRDYFLDNAALTELAHS
jgi:hypothetical protein